MELENKIENSKKSFFYKWTNGRLTRLDFLFGHIILTMISMFLFYVVGASHYFKIDHFMIFYFIFTFFVLLIEFGMAIRRCHDFNQGISFAVFFLIGETAALFIRFFDKYALDKLGYFNYSIMLILALFMILLIYVLKDKDENKYGAPSKVTLKLGKLFFNDLFR